MGLTDEQVAELRRLETEATPGPWQTWAQQPDVQVQRADGRCIASVEAWGGGRGIFDADLIAAMRNALLPLLDERDHERAMATETQRRADGYYAEILKAAKAMVLDDPRFNDFETPVDTLIAERDALRAEVERLTRERDEARGERDSYIKAYNDDREPLDAARKQALAERDAWRDVAAYYLGRDVDTLAPAEARALAMQRSTEPEASAVEREAGLRAEVERLTRERDEARARLVLTERIVDAVRGCAQDDEELREAFAALDAAEVKP